MPLSVPILFCDAIDQITGAAEVPFAHRADYLQEINVLVPLPAGQWKLLSDGTSSSLWRGESRTYEREALLMPYSATVFGAV